VTSIRFAPRFQLSAFGWYSHAQWGLPVRGTLLPISNPSSRKKTAERSTSDTRIIGTRPVIGVTAALADVAISTTSPKK